jgi:hypothetical protein
MGFDHLEYDVRGHTAEITMTRAPVDSSAGL